MTLQEINAQIEKEWQEELAKLNNVTIDTPEIKEMSEHQARNLNAIRGKNKERLGYAIDHVDIDKRRRRTGRHRYHSLTGRYPPDTYNLNGEGISLSGLAERSDLDRATIYNRIKVLEMSPADAIRERKYKIGKQTYLYNGDQYSIYDLAKLAGCSYGAMFVRLRMRSVEDAVAMGAARHNRTRGDRLTSQSGRGTGGGPSQKFQQI